jgi:hypothetical protein
MTETLNLELNNILSIELTSQLFQEPSFTEHASRPFEGLKRHILRHESKNSSSPIFPIAQPLTLLPSLNLSITSSLAL